MKIRFGIFAVLFGLLTCLPLSAQWSGGVDVAGGYGFMPSRDEDDSQLNHFLTKARVDLNYRNAKFRWNTTLDGSFENKETDSFRLSLSEKGGEDVIQADGIEKVSKLMPFSLNFRTSMLWTPDKGRSYELWFQDKYSESGGINGTYKSHYDNILDDVVDVNEKLYVEIPIQTDNNVQLGLRTSHQLGSPRKVLKGELILDRNGREKDGQWIMGDVTASEEISSFSSYRITPRSATQLVSASAHLLDSVITQGPCRLLLDPGLRFFADYTRDRNSGSTYDPATESWRDSTRLRENFNFLAVRIEPCLGAEFRWKEISASANYALQLYGRRLTDETHQQPLKMQRPSIIGHALVGWQITPQHRVSLKNNISIKHPEYIQICWYERQGNYLTQIYRGKESLLPTQTRSYALEYAFNHKRFQSSASVGYAYRDNEIDQTFTKEVIDGRDYQMFTWVNAADSRIFEFTGQLGWRGKVLQANLGTSNKATTRQARESGAIKRSFDWRAWGDATVVLPRGWSLSVDAHYKSNVATFFTMFGQYCALNAQVQKRFKRVNVYLQGRDLLDNQIRTEFISEDETNGWVEISRLNRRMVILGVQWRWGK